MNKSKKLILLLSATMLLAGCDDTPSSSSSSSINGSDASSDSASSTQPALLDWTADQKTYLEQYCGEIIAYPFSSNANDIVFNLQYDENNSRTYLLIAEESDTFTIEDYFVTLEKASWSGIRDYNGNIEQTEDGTTYYELTKTSNDKGYEIIYQHFSEGNEDTDRKYNMIQCYNDLDYKEDEKTSWTAEEKKIFEDTIISVPSLLKLGKVNKVGKNGQDMAYVYDNLAMDLTLDNVGILKNDGYVLNDALSKERGSYVLEKKIADGESITASIFYSAGNVVTFAYQVETKYSESWPAALFESFKAKTGYDLPTFYSSLGYYYYTKKGVTTIYSYTNDAYTYYHQMQMNLEQLLIVDNDYSWYTDWNETFYIRPQYGYEEQLSMQVFGYSFGTLDESYDTIKEGWPSENVSNFMTKNNIEGDIPSFDVLSLAASNNVRVKETDYDDIYALAYAAIKANPTSYGLEEGATEEQIKAKAEEKAKEKTMLQIKFYDQGVYQNGEKVFKVYEALETTLKKAGWSTDFDYDWRFNKAFENASGSMRIGISYYANVTTLSITYGSGKTHSPIFRFETKNKSVAPGSSYNLDMTIDMLPLDEVTYSSNNGKITVNEDGCVSVAEDATPGDSAIITATVTDSNGKVYSDTCTISVAVSYTKESAAKAVAKSYNAKFNFVEGDDGYVTIANMGEDPEWPVYFFKAQTDFATLSELEAFVDENLIPSGFNTYYDEWDTDLSYDDGTSYEAHSYTYIDDEYNTINMNFNVYIDPTTNKVVLYVRVS